GSATGTGRRPPRSYGHLEGDVRWRRLFSATRFFLRIDGGGGVEGTRWRERPGSEWGRERDRDGEESGSGAVPRPRRARADPAGCRGCGRGGRCRGWTGEEAGRRRLGSATGPLHARPRESPRLFPLGKSQPNPNCKFTERIEENGYNTYASLHWRHRGRPMFLSLNSKGRPRQGGKTRRQHLSTHFLPMLVS
ncbi:FGF22 factor, partial [Aphelocoma coerulescens]|nr:FGF22 factor [Aphelocoma coerulescens]